MGQSAHLRLVRALLRPGSPRIAGVAAAALVTAVTVTGCGSSLASATTTVRGAVEATVVHADGSEVAAVDGLRLRHGDLVRTGPAGRVELVTRSRDVYVGSDASVQVLDGAHQQLRHGAVVVDAQHGSGLALQMGGLEVNTPAGAATRAERSVTVRVAALAGDTRVESATGRSLTVRALHQVLTGGDALPDTTTPLRLTDDDGEAHAVPQLVRDDRALLTLARGIDGAGKSTAAVVTAAWHAPVLRPPSGVARSEQVLPVVIATAGPRTDAVAHYRDAVDYRSAGGSWGVVAHLLDVRADAVVAALTALERGQPAGQIGDIRALVRALGAGGGGGGGSTGPGGGGSNPQGSGGGGGGGGKSPTPSPTPGTVGQVTGTVDDTVNQVLSVVPTPTPTPSLSPGVLTSALPLPK